MKRIIAKIAGLVYENTKFFQKILPLKKGEELPRQ